MLNRHVSPLENKLPNLRILAKQVDFYNVSLEQIFYKLVRLVLLFFQ